LKKNIFYLPLIVLLIVGCVQSGKIISLPPEQVTQFSKIDFDGNYSNSYLTLAGDEFHYANKMTLAQILSQVQNSKLEWLPYSDSAIINLEFTENKLKIKVLENSVVEKEMELKAKVKNKYLSIKRKFILVPIPMFFLKYNHKLFMCINGDGNLVAKYGYSHGAWIIIVANGTAGFSSTVYKKAISQ
jgi:hypothetical protein